MPSGEKLSEWKNDFIRDTAAQDFPIHRAYRDLSDKERELLWKGGRGIRGIDRFFQYVEEKSYKIQYRVLGSRYRGKTTCPTCNGSRLRPDATHVKIGGRSITELVHLPIVLLAGAMGVWLFYVQHTFAGAYWARKENWDAGQAAVVGSSYFDLPRVLHWFTGNIGYHHIHHLASRIPNYRLREAFESSTLLQSAPRLTLWTSLKSIRLKLWDEQSQRMVGFGYRKALA